MFKLISPLIIIAIFTQVSFAKTNILKKFCDKYAGEVRFGFTCPKSKIPLPLNMCTFKNQYGEKQFFDGCTGPTGGFKELFYPACITHDLCYHHEPASSGKTQEYCDQLFYELMQESCQKTPQKKKCLRWAKSLFNIVRKIGKAAYHCENIVGPY